MTYMRDWLPGEIEGQYLHKKVDYSDKTNVAPFFDPVVTTNKIDKLVEKITCDNEEGVDHAISKAFKLVHVPFQSTPLCNISAVNSLNYCKTSAMIRERGNFYNRMYWEIDMNEVRQLYLGAYSCIDSIDHLIKKST